MLFMWMFLIMGVLTIKNTRTVRKMKRRLESLEAALVPDVTQEDAAGPLAAPGDRVTSEEEEVAE